MQLKILLSLILLILTFFSYANSKSTKLKYTLNSNVSSLTKKSLNKIGVLNTKLNTNSNLNNNIKIDPAFFNEKFEYNFSQSYNLMKKLANQLFIEKEKGLLDMCIDIISKYNNYLDPLLKSFWIKMNEIYDEYQKKNQMDSVSNVTPTANSGNNFDKLINWKKIIIDEFQNIMKYVNFEETRKNSCSKIFSDTPRNLFDLLFVLQDTNFFGGRYYTGKNDQFIDSMLSVHRDRLPADTFNKINQVSSNLLNINNDQLRNIMAAKSYSPPIKEKKISPYGGNENIEFSNKYNPPKLQNSLNELKKDEYNLITFGDIGNIEYFAKNSFANQGNKKPTPEIIDKWYSDYLNNENYDLSNLGCKVTLSDPSNQKPKLTTDLEKQEGLVHFNQILKNSEVSTLLRESSGFVLLGDMVYTEQKFLTKAKKDDIGVTLDHMDKWRQRLECGWNLFYRSLESIDIMKITGNDNNSNNLRGQNENKSDMSFFLYDNAELLAGNHSFDVDVNSEEKYLKSLKPFSKKNSYLYIEAKTFGEAEKKTNLFTYTPKFITITYKDFKIQFLDFNSQIVSCLKGHEVAYKNCNKWNPSVLPYTEAVEYGKRFEEALQKFEDDSSTYKIWRVMRAHHPPLNSEDGDAEFYFEDLNLGNKTINIFNLMKNKRVNMFLGSHIHNAQAVAYPYSRQFKKPASSCSEQPGDKWGCFKVEPNVFNKNPVYQSQCDNNLVFNLPVRDRTDPSQTNDMLYIFITGNSGRIYDGLKEGKKSDGILLWSRATQNAPKKYNYGFSYYRFSKFQVEVEFYEAADEGRVLLKGATFLIKEGKLPDAKMMEDFMNTKCLQ